MNENAVKAFNKNYKINNKLASKFVFVANKDKIQASSIAGKPKKMSIEILKRFFTNPIVIISLIVFTLILMLSIIVPAVSPYKPNASVSSLAFDKSLPSYLTQVVKNKPVDSNSSIYQAIVEMRKLANTDPQFKSMIEFFLKTYSEKSTVGYIKISYNAYFLIAANKIYSEYVNHAITTSSEALAIKNEILNSLSGILLGTSSTGYDIWSTAWYATWRAIKIALIVVVLEAIVGVSIGAYLGFHAGKLIDTISMRIIAIFTSPPTLIWILIFVSIFGANQTSLIASLTIAGWPGFVGITRMFVITVKDEEYIVASKAIGATTRRQIFVHALPSIVGKIANSFVKSVPATIIWIASLAFLGFFKEKNDINLGQMLIEASSDTGSNIWIVLLPTLILLGLSLSLNFIALGIHDALDPKVMSKGRRK